MRTVRAVGQPVQLAGQIPRHPPVHRRPVHSRPRGYLNNISAIQDRPDRIQALLHQRQDNQCQSRPPQSDAPRKRRTRVAETRPLSHITWRKNVARQPTEDKPRGPDVVRTFSTYIKGALRAPGWGCLLILEAPATVPLITCGRNVARGWPA
jgi:hypothetical protein